VFYLPYHWFHRPFHLIKFIIVHITDIIKSAVVEINSC
jgi:hypothetical protein